MPHMVMVQQSLPSPVDQQPLSSTVAQQHMSSPVAQQQPVSLGVAHMSSPGPQQQPLSPQMSSSERQQQQRPEDFPFSPHSLLNVQKSHQVSFDVEKLDNFGMVDCPPPEVT